MIHSPNMQFHKQEKISQNTIFALPAVILRINGAIQDLQSLLGGGQAHLVLCMTLAFLQVAVSSAGVYLPGV